MKTVGSCFGAWTVRWLNTGSSVTEVIVNPKPITISSKSADDVLELEPSAIRIDTGRTRSKTGSL
jgi:hypothetical protein